MNKEGQTQEPVGGIVAIRNWIRSNGEMSEDGKTITYNCEDLENIIAQQLAAPIKTEGEDEKMKGIKKWIEERMSLFPDDPNLSERGAYDAYLNVLNIINIIPAPDVEESEIEELREEAQDLLIKIAPPETFGEDADCERIYNIIDELAKAASLPQSSNLKEGDWKKKFIEWLDSNRKLFNGLPASSTIADHVERYVRPHPKTLKVIPQDDTTPMDTILSQSSTEEEKELAELRCWKESAMKVMADMQEIGKELGVKLGESIHDKILPAIINYKKLLTGSPPPDVEALAKDYVKTLKITNRNEIEYAIQDFKAGYSASQKVKNANELFRDDFQAYADRILRDKGASNKDVFDAINDTIQELSKKYNITIVASLPSSSVTGEEDWKFKFSEWLINNRGLPPIVVDIIVAHVERYIVKSIPVTGEWQLCPKCNGEGFLQIGKAIPDGRIDFTCEVCNGKKILAKPGESEAIGFAEWMGKGFEMIIDGSWECFSEEYCEKYNLQLDEHYTTSELLSTYKQSKK